MPTANPNTHDSLSSIGIAHPHPTRYRRNDRITEITIRAGNVGTHPSTLAADAA